MSGNVRYQQGRTKRRPVPVRRAGMSCGRFWNTVATIFLGGLCVGLWVAAVAIGYWKDGWAGSLFGLLALMASGEAGITLGLMWTDADMNDPMTAFALGDYKQEKFGRGGPGYD